ncbi:MAG TPA: D-alanine--D-alanine ligase [Candidatus Krumholzibacteria bacterium]|nr:D-alanine--D-alanine ligase [Candidatus Krumholzibacteria bacterium]
MKKLVVLLLAGGDSPERDVSLSSSRGIAKALRDAGHRVLVADPAQARGTPTEYDEAIFDGATIGKEPPRIGDVAEARAAFVRLLASRSDWDFDIVFNGLHGGAGENGSLQAVLDYLGIPYTGSGAAASALAMDKQRAKIIAASAGVPVPQGLHVERSALGAGTLEQQVRETLGLPLVVKPNAQGSSVGLSIVHSYEELDAAARTAFAVDDSILIERYIEGREITQAIVEGAPDLPLLEIKPKSGLYDYYHKYQAGNSEYLCPAPVEEKVAREVLNSTKRAFAALGLSVYSRLDFRLDPHGRHYLLEANTLPGMTATSLVPKAAATVGISYAELCDRIVRQSLARFRS